MTGELYAKPKEGTSRNGNTYVTARLLVAIGEDRLFASCIAFDEDACAAVLAMDEGKSVSVAGELRPKVSEAKDGSAKVSPDVTAHAVLTTYHVKRKRQAVQGGKLSTGGAPGFDDATP